MKHWMKWFLVPLAVCGAVLVLWALARLSYAVQGMSMLEGILVALCLIALRVWYLLLRDRAADRAIRPPVLALLLKLILHRRENPVSPQSPPPSDDPGQDELQLKRQQNTPAIPTTAGAAPDTARAAARSKA
jgi:hypothetical protein